MPREVRIRLNGPLASGQKEQLSFDIDGTPVRMRFRVGELSRKLVTAVPEVVHDLLDIAATVYAADCNTSRGGLTDSGFGKDWRRQFLLEIPVRRRDVWQQETVSSPLRDVLGFLSDDFWNFTFTDCEDAGPRQSLFNYGPETAHRPGSVLMFSGGLDSYAGAVEELVERRERVILVSHASATKMAAVQKNLVKVLKKRVGPEHILHVPLTAQMAKGGRKEGTQRSRSFLFAAIGHAVAEMYGLKTINFFENGVVSLNLPPVPQVVGARATRTTHPKVLGGLSRLFSVLHASTRAVRNPYLFRTKGDILATIERLGFADQIRDTRSCADVHHLSTMLSHCGRCSQCIDRRFAVLSQGMEEHDPPEAYAIDLFEGERNRVQDREMALSYVRNARFFALARIDQFKVKFPEILRAVAETDDPSDVALQRLHALHQRHGEAVTKAMDAALTSGKPHGTNSLPALYRASELEKLTIRHECTIQKEDTRPFEILLDRQKMMAVFSGGIELGGVVFKLLVCLAEPHLTAAGQGLAFEDYPCLTARAIADKTGYAEEDSVRRAVQTVRRKLKQALEGLGHGGDEIIENLQPYGYRLAPDRIRLRVEPASAGTKKC